MSSIRAAGRSPDKRLIDYPRAGRRMPWALLPSWRQILVLGLLAGAMLVGSFFVAYARTTIPSADAAATQQTSLVYYSDRKTLIGKISGGTNRTTINDVDTIPLQLRQAVMAAEDRDFETNSGVSPKGIARAFWTNLTSDSKSQGGSTITQQFVRNYYADVGAQKTYQRKIHEAILAIKINKQKSKDEILQDYLNTIWWGRRSYGLYAAAQSWFPRGVNDYKSLNLSQSAFLAAAIQSPDGFDYLRETTPDPAKLARAEARFRYVLNGMAEKGWITQEQADSAKLPRLAPRASITTNYNKGPSGFLLQYVRDELGRDGFTDQEIEGGGMNVFTTFDKTAQDAAVEAMKPDTGQFPRNADDVHSGLASIDAKNGAILAMYGGKDYLERQINDATQGVLTGSTFKPFALAAALEDGRSIYSRFSGNSPLQSTKTRNEFGQDYGSQVTLLKGLEESINTVYVDAAMDIGPEKVVKAVEAAGVPKNAPGLAAVPSVPLGTTNVSPLDMALAYSSFANGGSHVEKPHSVATISFRGGGDAYKTPTAKTIKAFDRDVAADVTYALQQVVRSGTGTAAQSVGTPVAGKTGTHGQDDDTLSAWFVGYSPRIVTAVDFYRGDARQDLDGVGGDGHAAFFGGGFPARIWTAYMKTATALPAYRDAGPFPELACVNCRDSDRLGGSGSSGTPQPDPSQGQGDDGPGDNGRGDGGPGDDQSPPAPSPSPSTPTSPAPADPGPAQPAPQPSTPGEPVQPADPAEPVQPAPAALSTAAPR